MKTNNLFETAPATALECREVEDTRLTQRVYRVLMMAFVALACACLSRMADGQTPPRLSDMTTGSRPGALYSPVALFGSADKEVTPASHSNIPSATIGNEVATVSSSCATCGKGGSGGMLLGETDCSCRNVPGGYPCLGGCQPCMSGVDCASKCGEELSWEDMRPMDFNSYAHGGYAGPARLAHLSHYRLRPRDQLQVIYLITRRQGSGAYRLEVGDEVMIESVSDADLTRGSLLNGLQIQPDGTITVRILGQVHAAGLTVDALRAQLEKQYAAYYEDPTIDVTPVRTNTLAEDIRNAVGGQSGLNQQAINVVVMPDGKVRMPGIGEVCVQGLTLNEMKNEINLRYSQTVVGLEVEPILTAQAPHFVHVLGEVRLPNRVLLEGPTTVLSAIAVAGGPSNGANLRQVVVFRRAEDWRLISTMLDLQGAVYGKKPTPADEIWLRDGDVIVVPARPIVRFNWFVEQVFTRGAYGLIPPGLAVNLGSDAN